MITEASYRISLQTLEPSHVGGREDPLDAEHNLVVALNDKAAIPGSTLKGALRGSIERYLVDKYYDAKGVRWPAERASLQPCLAGTRPSVDERRLISQRMYRQRPSCSYQSPQELHGQPEPNGICPACYLLGAQGLVGFVRVPFLFSDRSPEELYSSRIDRAIGTVARGANRPYQVIPPAKFEGIFYLTLSDSVLGWSLGQPRPLQNASEGDRWLRDEPSWTRERIIKEMLVERLESINVLGGYKSKGFGRVKITVAEIKA